MSKYAESRRDFAEADRLIEQHAAAPTASTASRAQLAAENYRKPKRFQWRGLSIVIETPKGARRKWEASGGEIVEGPKMPADYGDIKRTTGADGDAVDVFVGPNRASDLVVIVDQLGKRGRFDEHKVLIGFASAPEAVKAYRAAYRKGWKVGKVTTMTVDQFKAWLHHGDQRQRVAKQVSRYQTFADAVELYAARRLKPSPGQLSLFDETKVNRHGKGSARGGQFAPKGEGDKDSSKQDTAKLSPADDYAANGTKAQAFKDWFGDWEKGEGSKVTKADGSPEEQYPITVYHGTAIGGFDKFDPAKDKGGNIYGKGFYFTADRGIAEEYTEKDSDSKDLRASAQGFKDLETGEKVDTLPAARAQAVRDLIGAKSYPNPNWDGAIIEALDEATGEGGDVDAGQFLDAYWRIQNEKYKDRGRSPAGQGLATFFEYYNANDYTIHNPGGKIEADTPPAELFEVYLNIRNPMDMNEVPSETEMADFLKGLDFHAYMDDILPIDEWESIGIDYSIPANEVTVRHLHAIKAKMRAETFQEDRTTWTGRTYKAGDPVWPGMHLSPADQLTWGDVQYMLTNSQKAEAPAFNEAIRKRGHDGIKHRGGWNIGTRGHDVWIAFDSNQIKAKDNAGTFDPEDDRMRYAAAGCFAEAVDFYAGQMSFTFDESKVTRKPKGAKGGGRFATKSATTTAASTPPPIKTPARVSRRQLDALAAQMGAEIEDDTEAETLTAWAPDGKVWAETGTRAISRQYANTGGQRYRADAQRQMFDDMKEGVIEDPDPDAPEKQETDEDANEFERWKDTHCAPPSWSLLRSFAEAVDYYAARLKPSPGQMSFTFDESKVTRKPKGSKGGGQFTTKTGAARLISRVSDREAYRKTLGDDLFDQIAGNAAAGVDSIRDYENEDEAYFAHQQNALHDSKHKPTADNWQDASEFFDREWIASGGSPKGHSYDISYLTEPEQNETEADDQQDDDADSDQGDKEGSKQEAHGSYDPGKELADDGDRVELPRAPAGGATSDVNGQFYKGGRIMPVHGLSAGQEKPKGKKKLDTGAGLPTANPEGKGRKPTARKMTPEQIKAAKQDKADRKAWATVQAGPIGQLLRLGDKPGKVFGDNFKDWVEAAPSLGDAAFKRIADESKRIYRGRLIEESQTRHKQTKAQATKEVDDHLAWMEQEQAGDDWWVRRNQKKATREFPNMLRARFWLDFVKEGKQFDLSEARRLHDLASSSSDKNSAADDGSKHDRQTFTAAVESFRQ